MIATRVKDKYAMVSEIARYWAIGGLINSMQPALTELHSIRRL